jgi:hypothetical protein
MIELFKQGSPRAVRRSMNTLLTRAFATFENAMKRIDDRPEMDNQLAKKALSYIFCARRPLSV